MCVVFSQLVSDVFVLSKVSCSSFITIQCIQTLLFLGELFFFYHNTMYSNSFVSRTRHNFLCICSQICISKEYFRFWGALCGLFANKSPIASLGLVHKTSAGRMAFFNSLRGTNKPRNGAQNLLRETQTSLRGTSNHSNVILTLLRQTQTSLRGTSNHSNVILTLLRQTQTSLRGTCNHSTECD